MKNMESKADMLDDFAVAKFFATCLQLVCNVLGHVQEARAIDVRLELAWKMRYYISASAS